MCCKVLSYFAQYYCQQTTDIDIALKVVGIDENRRKKTLDLLVP